MRIIAMGARLLMGLSFVVGALSASSGIGVESNDEGTIRDKLFRGYGLSSKEFGSRFLQESGIQGDAQTVFHRNLVLEVAQALSHKTNLDDEPVFLSLPLTGFIPILAGFPSLPEQDSALEFQVLECMTTKNGKDQQKAKKVPPGLVRQWPKFLNTYTMSCSGVAVVDLSAYGIGILSGSASFLCPQGNEMCEGFLSSAVTRKLAETLPSSDIKGGEKGQPAASEIQHKSITLTQMPHEATSYNHTLRGTVERSLATACPRPPGWCAHSGATYTFVDCDGDGTPQHVCWDIKGSRGVFGYNGVTRSCQDSWWTAPAGSCPIVFGTCERPAGWCTHPGATYAFVDCNGDGTPQHVCWDMKLNRGIIASSKSCADSWPNAAIDSCPSLFIPPKPLVSYVPDWAGCPTDAQVAKHTHLIYAFAHSANMYVEEWQCNQQCNAGCSITFNLPGDGNPGSCKCTDIKRWQEAGKKVLVSIGGDAQGRLYQKTGCKQPGCCPSCWDSLIPCGAGAVADRLVDIVNKYGFDGVDINYEYVVDDADVTKLHQDTGSIFASPSATYIQFLGDLTRQLKSKLPAGRKIVTHAPMAVKVSSGSPYFNLLGQLKDENMIDFVLPQYYNTVAELSPKNNFGDGKKGGLKAHYDALAARLGGDKVLIGLCPDLPEGIPGYNVLGCSKMDDVNADQVKALTTKVSPGGVMVWASQANVDVMESWSTAVYPNNQIIPTPGVAKPCFVACASNADCDATYKYMECDITATKQCKCQSWTKTLNGNDPSYSCNPGSCDMTKCGTTPAPAPTAPPTPAPTPTPTCAPTCFSGPSIVQVLNKGPFEMTELQIGDVLLTNTNHQAGGQVYEPIYAFGHLNYHSASIFLQILAMDSQFPVSPTTLEISPDHMVFLFDQPNPVPAHVVKAGDRLQGEGSSSHLTVVRVKSVQRHDGFFAPFTPSGRLVVDGIQVSAYVSLRNKDSNATNSSILYSSRVLGMISEQSLSHLMTSPLRVWCMAKLPFNTAKWCRHPSYYDQDGVLILAKTGKDLFEALAERHAVVQVVSLSVAFFVVTLIYALEVLFGAEYVLFAVSIMIVTVSFVRIMGLRFTVIGSRKKLKAA